MKSKTPLNAESHVNRSGMTNSVCGFSHPLARIFRASTAMLGAAAGVVLPAQAIAGEDHDHGRVEHVLLISVDGMHQSDLAWYVQNHPQSTLAWLTARGVDYSNASTPFPSDSFPGLVGQVTGGNPLSTGIYYDDTWNHDVFPAGTTNCVGRPRAQRSLISRPSTRTKALLTLVRASCRLRIIPIPGQTFSI
jgi:Type I phosphodiesterase / nucleotide pyrophosphatase